MSRLTNGTVGGLLTLLAGGKISDYRESLELLLSGINDATKKGEFNSLKQTMRGLWDGPGEVKLSDEEGKLVLKNIINQLPEFLKEDELNKFNLVIFKEMINWADTGVSQSLAFDAKVCARQLGIVDIDQTIDYKL